MRKSSSTEPTEPAASRALVLSGELAQGWRGTHTMPGHDTFKVNGTHRTASGGVHCSLFLRAAQR